MRRAIIILLESLHTIGLTVWLGGLIIIGAAVAPAAFHHAGLTESQAAIVVGESVRLFTRLAEWSGLAMVGVQFLLRRRYQRDRALYIGDGVRQLIVCGALLAAEFCRYTLFPEMDAARMIHDTVRFKHLHHVYTSVSMVQLVLLIVVAGIGAWLQAPREARASAPAKAPAPAVRVEPAPAQASRRAARPAKRKTRR
jgi:hypothetical protein